MNLEILNKVLAHSAIQSMQDYNLTDIGIYRKTIIQLSGERSSPDRARELLNTFSDESLNHLIAFWDWKGIIWFFWEKEIPNFFSQFKDNILLPDGDNWTVEHHILN